MPPSWVVRRKDQDYGVDLEVEIFDDDGTATGLIFLVQVRATDNPKGADRISLQVDQLSYFRNLDVPVLVARYLSEPESWFVEWAFNMGFGLAERQASFTHRFTPSNRWTSDKPRIIRRTLEVLRMLNHRPSPRRIGIRIDPTGMDASTRYAIESAVEDVIEATSEVTYLSENTRDFAVDLRRDCELLRLELDCVASATFASADWERHELKRRIIYGLILICRARQLDTIASAIAAAALRQRLDPQSRQVAIEAAAALAPDLEAVVQLALLGRLHEEHDGLYAGLIAFLLRTPASRSARSRAIKAFYFAAIESAATVTPEREGAVRYSLANYLRGTEELNLALREYTLAKRLRPSYLTTDYFLHEVGVCLFDLGRHRCARTAYQRSVDAGCDTQRALIHLADASLFSGDLTSARATYERASEGEDQLATAEAMIKAGTCDWLAELVGSENLATERSPASVGPELSESDLLDVITNVHGLDRVAHYELGVIKASQSLWQQAIGHFLAAAIADDQDFDAWTNAIICAWNIGQPDFIIGIISTAVARAGRGAFDRLRETLIGQEAHPEMLAGLEEIFRQIAGDVRQAHANDITLRALREAHYDVTVIAES